MVDGKEELERLVALGGKVSESAAEMERSYNNAVGHLYDWVSALSLSQRDHPDQFTAKCRAIRREPDEFVTSLWDDADSIVEDRSKVEEAVQSGISKFEFIKRGSAVGLRSVHDFASTSTL